MLSQLVFVFFPWFSKYVFGSLPFFLIQLFFLQIWQSTSSSAFLLGRLWFGCGLWVPLFTLRLHLTGEWESELALKGHFSHTCVHQAKTTSDGGQQLKVLFIDSISLTFFTRLNNQNDQETKGRDLRGRKQNIQISQCHLLLHCLTMKSAITFRDNSRTGFYPGCSHISPNN